MLPNSGHAGIGTSETLSSDWDREATSAQPDSTIPRAFATVDRGGDPPLMISFRSWPGQHPEIGAVLGLPARYQHVTDPIRQEVAARVGDLLWAGSESK
jgi:hypothetical protein